MTRSLAENYPYSRLYKADLKGPFYEWIEIVEGLESNTLSSRPALEYLTIQLLQYSEHSKSLANSLIINAEQCVAESFEDYRNILINFYTNSDYKARAFEVVLHSFVQALFEMDVFSELELVPLSQMRNANKKHGNVGDIELAESGVIVQAWDAKYDKCYLRDELEELFDKIENNSNIQVAGFVVNKQIDMCSEIVNRQQEIEDITGISIMLMDIDAWIRYMIPSGISEDEEKMRSLGKHWLMATAETFGLRRMAIAPLDEPCDNWVSELISAINTYSPGNV